MIHRLLVLAAVPAAALALAGGGSARGEGGVSVRVSQSGGQTVVRTVSRHTGEVVTSQRLRGSYRLPAVVPGVREGLSSDGSTIVLQGKVAATGSTYALLASAGGKPASLVRLPGRFEYDALSPNGRLLYLTQSLVGTDGRYLVRVYDVARARLLPQPVTEKGEEPGPMAGYAVSRVTSGADGWVFTAYRAGLEGPFVHALQTTSRTAACIDLRPRDPRERPSDRFWRLRLTDGGATLLATNAESGERVAVDLSQGWPVRA